jgi:hypothetical protein
MRIGRDALAAGGRRAGKELGMPVAGDRLRLKDRGAGLDLDQHDHGGRDRNRGSRMHGTMHSGQWSASVSTGCTCATWTTVQQRQQDKAHHGNHRQSKRLCAAFPAEFV